MKRFLSVLLACTLLIGAAPASALTNEEIALLKAPNRQAILEEGAKKEGAFIWYCTLREDLACRPMNEQFGAKYPFIKSQYQASDSTAIMQRALAEARARTVRVDVLQASIASSLKGTNLEQAFWSPEMAAFDPAMLASDGTWVSIWEVWNGIYWNTTRVKAADAPRSWEALADPRYKGMMYWGSFLTAAPRLITHFRMMMGEDRALDFLKKLQANQIHIAPGDAGASQVGLTSGEYPILIGGVGLHQMSPARDKGAPIDGVNPNPAMARTSAIALMRNAPHPHAAMLFLDYILSEEGQNALAKSGNAPTRKGASPLPEHRWYVPALNGQKEIVLSTEQENAMYEKSNVLFNEMFK